MPVVTLTPRLSTAILFNRMGAKAVLYGTLLPDTL